LESEFYDYVGETLKIANSIGALLVTVNEHGTPNVMTIGWLLLGPCYRSQARSSWNPIAVIAVHPDRYTFQLLDETEEFVIAVPSSELEEAVAFCGEKSGRDIDKFVKTGLTPTPSIYVTPPSIKECPINIECKIYNTIRPPHHILTPEHRKAPLSKQHTIYFAEVLNVATNQK
jgi:flavin reductase (DIM6/NTAB) family NADH-FMN oxidoreductase RutF